MRKDIDPRATAKQQVVAVHECLDEARDEIAQVGAKLDAHITRTDENFALAQTSREEIAAAANETARVVRENRGAFDERLGEVKSALDVVLAEQQKHAKTLEATNVTLSTVSKTVGGYEGVRKAVFALAGAAAIGAAGVIGAALVPHFLPPANVATKADVAAHTSDRYTGADAARDRAAQDARDQQILATIQQVEATAQADHQTLVGTDRTANPRGRR
jgi:hypothetical protein